MRLLSLTLKPIRTFMFCMFLYWGFSELLKTPALHRDTEYTLSRGLGSPSGFIFLLPLQNWVGIMTNSVGWQCIDRKSVV